MNISSFRQTVLVGLTVSGLAVVACGKDAAPSDVTGTGGTSGAGGKATSATGGAKSAGGASASSGGAGTGAKAGAGGAGGGDVPDASAGGTGGTDDGGTPATGGAGGDPDCFTNPKTHLEIINACTNAEKVDKTPKVPLLLPDGGLPALP